ncbi:MAG: glycoside hydrolase family 3 C-terminal domain-containing protein, partial [Muribaculaceae bacterium]|nr:glycoside hydrolase family 3 C-terminal domain-containing protein [Muribaculaceae bacterium]
NPTVVLVIQSCSSMTVNWAQENVPAIIEAWYDGQAQGRAIADVLYGDFNPSGHLTSTWYSSLSALPSGMMNYDIRSAGYTYMYHKGTPLYPFGHGLSYTTFEYADLAVSSSRLDKDATIDVTATVTNTGKRAGADVVQLYARCNSAIERPQMQLVGFARVELEPGESTTVTIPLRHDQLTYFNTDTQTFDVEDGTVELMLAASAGDVRQRTNITTEGAVVKYTYKSDPASVQQIETDAAATADGAIFDLTGRRLGTSLDALAPGYYIIGGRVIRK